MALANIYRVVQDLEGNVVTGVLGTVTLHGTSTLAALYADDAGTLPLPNPTTNNAQYGSFSLYVNAGAYDMQFVKAGFTFEPQYNITLRDPTQGVTQVIGSNNRIIVSPLAGVGTVTLSTPQDINQDANVQFAHLGLGIPPSPTYGLYGVNGTSLSGGVRLDRLGVGVEPPATSDAYIGNHLGVAMTPDLSVAFSVANGATMTGGVRVDSLGVNVAPPGASSATIGSNLTVLGQTALSGTLTVAGLAQFSGAALSVSFPNRAGDNQIALFSDFAMAPGTGRAFINHQGTANSYFGGGVEVLGRMALANTLALNPSAMLKIDFTRGTYHGILIRPNDSDTVGSGNPIIFVNTGLSPVGTIQTTATTTAYNTTSDARLKHDVTVLTGALDVVRALNPVSFRWKADGSPGRGFLAHEVAEVVDGVITGEKGALDDAGNVQPQQIDYSKLVPWLVGAIQTLVQRLEVVEDAAGI